MDDKQWAKVHRLRRRYHQLCLQGHMLASTGTAEQVCKHVFKVDQAYLKYCSAHREWTDNAAAATDEQEG